MAMWNALLLAIQFLTRIPLRLNSEQWRAETQGQAVACYPLVGVLIGAAVALLGQLSLNLDPHLSAFLVLLLWVAITGGLHLDGVADCADAWAGGHGEPARLLRIMKDTHNGSWAIIALLLVLLGKYAALISIAGNAAWAEVIWIPVLARAVAAGMLCCYPYVRVAGLGTAAAMHVWRSGVVLVCAALGLLAYGFAGDVLLAMVLATALVFAAFHWLLLRPLQGITGDTLGAAIELTETASLLALAVCIH